MVKHIELHPQKSSYPTAITVVSAKKPGSDFPEQKSP
jgi:hypothetical protein